MCGKLLLIDEDTRYIVDIKAYAAYDPMEITPDDLAQDHRKQMQKLLDDMKNKDTSELEEEVAAVFRFDLCPGCQKIYIKNPLPGRP